MSCTSYCTRHWRILPGAVGLRAPVCIRCGSPNPRPLTEQEWEDAAEWSWHERSNPFVRRALDEHMPGWRSKFGGETA